MHARHVVLAALAAAVTLTSAASAGPDAAKQRVSITAKVLPTGAAVLDPLQAGALERDSGRFNGKWSPTPDRTVIRDGQKVDIHPALWTFTGKQGTIVFRERTEWVDIGNDSNRDGSDDSVAVGTWKVVRGTGDYAGIAGGGRSGHEGLGRRWYARYEGFLTFP
jgi:hypothetical protein